MMPLKKTTHRPSNRLYQNCKVYNSDGKHIFCSAFTRAEWYLNKGLAKIISENPFSIQLLFKCKGVGHSDDPYYLQDLINQCVVCASSENLTHHHCVPFSYRKHFPDEIKNHSHHDVLLVCIPCHDKYEKEAALLRKELAEEYNSPVNGYYLNKEEVTKNFHIKNLAAILSGPHKDKIPQERKNILFERIRVAIGKIPTHEELLVLTKIKPKPYVLTHAQLVVKQLVTYELLDTFCARWRKHFVETMQPKFLPQFWEVHKKINPERYRIDRKF